MQECESAEQRAVHEVLDVLVALAAADVVVHMAVQYESVVTVVVAAVVAVLVHLQALVLKSGPSPHSWNGPAGNADIAICAFAWGS